jgi:hypothetical protein
MPQDALRALVVLAFAVAALACSSDPPPDPVPVEPLAAFRPTEAQLLAIGRAAGVRSWHRDVALRCPYAESATEVEHAEARRACEVLVLEGDVLRATGIEGAFAAERLTDDAVLVLERDGALVARREDGTLVRALDVGVNEAYASDDGLRAVYTRDVAVEGGGRTEIAVVEIASGEPVLIATDATARDPRLVPGATDDVVFVSRRSGHAAIWRASAGGAAVQLTNQGAGEVPWGRRYELLTPVFGGDAAWLGDERDPTLLFWAELYGEPHAYLFHLADEAPLRLGPGFYTRQLDDGSIAGVTRSDGGTARVRRYGEGL